MLKAELTTKIAQTLKITKSKSEKIVGIVLQTVKQGIVEDGIVTLRGFGSFHARNKTQRMGRNPKTGESAVISARRVPSFKASKLLKSRLN
tara:strand:- start:770 stop:1042 length:273 start_codon:yes stop_codon:yes gene_type:complete